MTQSSQLFGERDKVPAFGDLWAWGQISLKSEKDLLGTIAEAEPEYFMIDKERPGMYIMTETQYTAADDAGLFDEFVDTIYAKTSGTDQGIANTASVMGDFTLALSEEQFKENCGGKRDGVDYCDLKYFIRVNPNDPKGMSYSFGDDNENKEFVTQSIRDNIKDKYKLYVYAGKYSSHLLSKNQIDLEELD